MNCSEGIPANPDVAGIGVRLSIYLQVVLPLVPQVVASIAIPRKLRMKSTADDVKAIMSSSLSIFVTGLLLLLSALIQARTIQLTAYHAILILNLNWLVVWASNGSSLFFSYGFLGSEVKHLGDKWIHDTTNKLILSIWAHGSLMSMFGIVFWATLDHFDIRTPGCTSVTVQSFLFHDYPLSSCRIGWLVIYSLLVIPGLNHVFLLVLLNVILVAPTGIIIGCLNGSDSGHILATATTIWSILLKIFFIASTELTIAHNYVQQGENQWTLGQTLALLLVLPTLKKTWEDAKTAFRMWKTRGRLQQMGEAEVQLKGSQVLDQSSGAKALAELSQYADVQPYIIENKIVDFLLGLLKSPDRDVRQASVDALEKFAKHSNFTTAFELHENDSWTEE